MVALVILFPAASLAGERQLVPATSNSLARRLNSESPIQLHDGDHVVLLGATFLEREQHFGHVEAALSAAAGTKHVTFRNLGWDGDTVFADSRGIFDTPAVGYQRMVDQIHAEKPTLILICFGQNEALSDDHNAEEFRAQLTKLIKDLSATQTRIHLVTPHELFPAVRPIPGPARFNARLKKQADQILAVADLEKLGCTELFTDFTSHLAAADRLIHLAAPSDGIEPDPVQHPDLWAMSATRWTANGMHLNDRGYLAASLVVRDRLLGIPAVVPEVRVEFANQTVNSSDPAVEIRNIKWNGADPQTLTFQLRAAVVSPLPTRIRFDEPPALISGTVQSGETADRLIPAGTSDAAALDSVLVPVDPQYRELVQAIVRKNELYFHRWRPQNITYLLGFRKHEQGNNAVELAQFDPLVAALEVEIHQRQQAAWRTVTLTSGR